jgi:tetratricopeptide (TPR) repeat protein
MEGHTMPASDIQLYRRDAELLYLRGLQCAREGNRADAAAALRQAISLNPLHEHAWLRLSDMLDDPHEIAFCLRVALQINPENAQAQRGIAWLRHTMHADQSLLGQRLLAPPSAGAPDAWWRAWHRAQRAWLWSLRTLLLIPIMLLGSTLSINAMIKNQPLPAFDGYQTPLAPVVPTITGDRLDSAALLGYYAALNAERQTLQAATSVYEATTNASQTTKQRSDAIRQMLQHLQQSHAKLAALPVPAALAGAHQQYLEGLALEHAALTQMLDLQSNYDPQRAREAIERLQQARAYVGMATSQWALFAEQHSVSGTMEDAR